MLNITVIIPTYNRINALFKTLEKILQCLQVPSEIVIVDQSIDADLNHKKIEQAFKVKYIGNLIYKVAETPSSTQARNMGMSLASNDIIVFMDDDVSVDIDTFVNLFGIMDNCEYAMIGGIDKLAIANGNIFPYVFAMRSYRFRNQGHVTKGMFGRYPTTIIKEVPTQWAMGYFFAIKRSLTEHWNLQFDEAISQYAYAEDLDFTYQYWRHAQKENLKCVLTPYVKVSHLCSKEWRTASKRISYAMVFNRYYLSQKHFGTFGAFMILYWSNMGVLIKKIIKNDNVRHFVSALNDCRKYKKDIKHGILHTELYN